jgi:poly-gamma-glutamate synthesis protein (capsule biosynthesis protein)
MKAYNPFSRVVLTKRRLYEIVLGILLVMILAAGLVVGWLRFQDNPASSVSVSSKVLFAGDINWGRDMRAWSEASPLKTAYPFSGLAGLHKENYDAWIGNLECPTVPGVTPTEYEERELLRFNCSTDYLPELAKWFDVVSLANNHSGNQDAAGLTKTRQQLDAQHIQYFSQYDPSRLDQACEVVSLPVNVSMGSGKEEKSSLPFALCGYNGVTKTPSNASLAVIKNYAKYMPVIAYPHMGKEYTSKANSTQTRLYRKMIDNGADAVLGNHPHWVQNSEAYKGKLIVYSMGNFIFDQQFSTNVMRSAVITMNLKSTNKLDAQQLAAWVKVGPTCQKYADTCLQTIEAQHLKRLPLSLTFGMQATDNTNKLTKPADAKLTQTVADRLNWNKTAAKLKPAGIPHK